MPDLVLLDNAATDDQVQPLVADGARTLVTSRRRLGGSPRAHRISLEVFEPAESAALIRRAAGTAVDDEPEAAVEIAKLVGHLPLALAVLAGRIKEQPDWTPGDHSNGCRSTPRDCGWTTASWPRSCCPTWR